MKLEQWIPARAASMEHEIIAVLVRGESIRSLLEGAMRMAAAKENRELTEELSPPRFGGFPTLLREGPHSLGASDA